MYKAFKLQIVTHNALLGRTTEEFKVSEFFTSRAYPGPRGFLALGGAEGANERRGEAECDQCTTQNHTLALTGITIVTPT